MRFAKIGISVRLMLRSIAAFAPMRSKHKVASRERSDRLPRLSVLAHRLPVLAPAADCANFTELHCE